MKEIIKIEDITVYLVDKGRYGTSMVAIGDNYHTYGICHEARNSCPFLRIGYRMALEKGMISGESKAPKIYLNKREEKSAMAKRVSLPYRGRII